MFSQQALAMAMPKEYHFETSLGIVVYERGVSNYRGPESMINPALKSGRAIVVVKEFELVNAALDSKAVLKTRKKKDALNISLFEASKAAKMESPFTMLNIRKTIMEDIKKVAKGANVECQLKIDANGHSIYFEIENRFFLSFDIFEDKKIILTPVSDIGDYFFNAEIMDKFNLFSKLLNDKGYKF